MAENQNSDEGNKGTNSYLKFTGMGFQMIAIIGAFSYAGYKIDEYAKHDVQWVTALMALIGVFISLYLVIRALKS
jgi:ATP synthase protein I